MHFTAPPVKGGVEAVVAKHAELLRRNGHRVQVVCGRGRSGEFRGVHYVRLPVLAATHATSRRIATRLAGGEIPSDFQGFVQAIESCLAPVLSDEDVVLVHNAFTLHFNAALTAALAKMAAQSDAPGRFIAWTHDIAVTNELYQADFVHGGYPWDLFLRPQLNVRYVTISETRRRELLALWRSKSVESEFPVDVIPNGIDPADGLHLSPSIAALVDRYDALKRDDVLLSPVRITRRKRLEFAIETLAQMRRQGRDSILLVTGPVRGHHPARSAAYLHELRELAARLGMIDNVLFLAQILGRPLQDREVAELYTLATILFLPSASEGFGLPVLEGALHRIPIVASDLPVLRELVGENATFLPSEATPVEACTLMKPLMKDHRDVLRRSVVERFSWDRIYAENIEPLLTSIGNR